MKFIKRQIKKILVIKFGGIGDVLLSTVLLPNLKDYFPKSEIYFLTHYKCRDVLSENPYITRYLTFDFDMDESFCFIKNIKNQKYDMIIDLFGNPRTAFVTFYSRAKYRVGYNFRNRKYAYNIVVEGRGGKIHNVDFNLDALRKLDIPITKKHLEIFTNEYYKKSADRFINKTITNGKKIFGIVISGGWESKKYKTNDYVELIGKIKKQFDCNILLLWGTADEKKECDEIHNKMKDFTYIIPETNLQFLAELMRKCSLIVANDSGMLHLAVAAGVPVLGIYGPTNPALQGPYGDNNLTIVNENLDCLDCNLLDCPIGNVCMTELNKDNIISKIKGLIQINNLNL